MDSSAATDMRILFIGPLPEPVTGQSLACKVFLDGRPPAYSADVVDLSKKEFRQGVSSGSRVLDVLKVLWRVWRHRRGADVIYLTVSESIAGNIKDLCIFLLCYRQLSRVVIHLHGGAGMKRIMAGQGVVRGLNAFFLRRLGGVIILGQSHMAIYRGVVPPERLHVVPNFAEDHLFTTVDGIEAKFAQTSPLRLLFLSNLLPGKGHDALLDAFLALDEQIQHRVRIDFAGGFESQTQQEQFLARLKGRPQLEYHGIVGGERKAALFARAHVFCLPTSYPYEGQPISILEAYASGAAVITTNHSGIPDVFQDGVNGFLVEARSASDVRSAIERAVRQPGVLQRIAVTNLAAAQERYRAADYQRTLWHLVDTVARKR